MEAFFLDPRRFQEISKKMRKSLHYVTLGCGYICMLSFGGSCVFLLYVFVVCLFCIVIIIVIFMLLLCFVMLLLSICAPGTGRRPPGISREFPSDSPDHPWRFKRPNKQKIKKNTQQQENNIENTKHNAKTTQN